jgi:hypothetical protein
VKTGPKLYPRPLQRLGAEQQARNSTLDRSKDWVQSTITPGLSLRLDEKRGSRHVLRVKSRGPRDFVVVKGNAATISVGKSISTIGNWVNDRDHGLQF